MSITKVVLLLTLIAFALTGEDDGFCGYDHNHYDTVEEAHAAGTGIIGCGPCGACSTIHDVQLYKDTKENLTLTSRRCAWLSFISGDWSKECLIRHGVDFTDDCMDCWIENIICDRKHCALKCILSILLDEPYVDEEGHLNRCLQCDEDVCGPAFKECAGANRRRSCIASDIMRDEKLICKSCDPFPEPEPEI